MENLITEFLDKSVIDALSTLLSTTNTSDINKTAVTVANSFGAGEFSVSTKEDEAKLITSFKKNLSLLIEKTWVEQFDIALKEEVLYKLGQYCAAIEQDKWAESYGSFIKILNDVIYLMFGAQSKTPEFAEYALRIDPEFGIFWWYVKSLPEKNDWSEDKNRLALLIAMFFLANY